MNRSDFRSNYEFQIAQALGAAGMGFEYEPQKLHWVQPEVRRSYIPDFVLDNGIIIEVKGKWTLEDRKKMVHVIEQNPKLDIRMLFMRNNTITKNSRTRYSDWCAKRGIKYAIGQIPEEWLRC